MITLTNSKVGKIYAKTKTQFVFSAINENEFKVNGHTIFVDMGNNWVSNPPVNNPILKQEINAYIYKNF